MSTPTTPLDSDRHNNWMNAFVSIPKSPVSPSHNGLFDFSFLHNEDLFGGPDPAAPFSYDPAALAGSHHIALDHVPRAPSVFVNPAGDPQAIFSSSTASHPALEPPLGEEEHASSGGLGVEIVVDDDESVMDDADQLALYAFNDDVGMDVEEAPGSVKNMSKAAATIRVQSVSPTTPGQVPSPTCATPVHPSPPYAHFLTPKPSPPPIQLRNRKPRAPKKTPAAPPSPQSASVPSHHLEAIPRFTRQVAKQIAKEFDEQQKKEVLVNVPRLPSPVLEPVVLPSSLPAPVEAVEVVEATPAVRRPPTRACSTRKTAPVPPGTPSPSSIRDVKPTIDELEMAEPDTDLEMVDGNESEYFSSPPPSSSLSQSGSEFGDPHRLAVRPTRRVSRASSSGGSGKATRTRKKRPMTERRSLQNKTAQKKYRDKKKSIALRTRDFAANITKLCSAMPGKDGKQFRRFLKDYMADLDAMDTNQLEEFKQLANLQ
ncbi:hypothetical protein L198_06524 [Cryptococcus wingfieldii CBS 7118]|uniref:BZIP domain-containing protein n=1 Tax=Cryptococcus wingfieldii CBS 7118 TaxID=1295528 RepID=A0A1E3IND1_9TREE|nr:hypothetical protein L198_06524 [Cryptococcus wingfieldii CBS 7118]ODN89201.1 hypothetical protein L198_06524 [Cryptococcus wingfieldii CBS 7118]